MPRGQTVLLGAYSVCNSLVSLILGLRIRLSTFPDLRDMCSSAYQTRDVFFGDSVQDVEAAIGAPSRTFYKSEDKMKIHSPNAYRKAASHKSDYFYNYFTLGIVSTYPIICLLIFVGSSDI